MCFGMPNCWKNSSPVLRKAEGNLGSGIIIIDLWQWHKSRQILFDSDHNYCITFRQISDEIYGEIWPWMGQHWQGHELACKEHLCFGTDSTRNPPACWATSTLTEHKVCSFVTYMSGSWSGMCPHYNICTKLKQGKGVVSESSIWDMPPQ